jgi:undecaprenyl diphosphate synthase
MIKHLAVIMDGNRRWAVAHGMKAILGHHEGAKAVEHAIKFCLDSGISFLSLYTFSLENFKRSVVEKEYLFDLIVNELENRIDSFIEKDVRVKFIGDRTLFPAHVMPVCRRVEQLTSGCSKLTLNFLFCYGARQEIVEGVRKIVRKIKSGEITESELSDEVFEQNLWSHGTPAPDVIIRTGGRKRLSNFLLYQSAYSEFCFLDCLWPDITVKHFETVLNKYNDSTRNFGI